MHNFAAFFRDFFSLKIGVFINFFHKNNLFFSVNGNVYRKSNPYSPILCSTTSRKVGMQLSHFAISTNFLANEQSAKAKLKMVQEVQIGRYKPRKWRRKRSIIKFRRPGTFDKHGRWQKLDNQNVGRRLEYGPFDYRSSFQKARKSIEIGWMGPPWPLRLQQSRMCPNIHRFAAAKLAN